MFPPRASDYAQWNRSAFRQTSAKRTPAATARVETLRRGAEQAATRKSGGPDVKNTRSYVNPDQQQPGLGEDAVNA